MPQAQATAHQVNQNKSTLSLGRVPPTIYDDHPTEGVDIVYSDRLPPVKALEDADFGDVGGGEHCFKLKSLVPNTDRHSVQEK